MHHGGTDGTYIEYARASDSPFAIDLQTNDILPTCGGPEVCSFWSSVRLARWGVLTKHGMYSNDMSSILFGLGHNFF